MKENIQFEYSFEKKSRILKKDSKSIRQYETSFMKDVKPVIQEIEKRKSLAHEKVTNIRISYLHQKKYNKNCESEK